MEELRQKMYETIEKFGISSKEALEASQELDRKMNKEGKAK